MNNYEPPSSQLVKPLDQYDRLIAEQSYLATFLASIIGVCGGTIVFVIFTKFIVIPIVVLIAPGIAAGYITKFTGKAWQMQYRVVCGVVVLGVFTILPMIISGAPDIVEIFIGLPNAAIAMFLAKRNLTYEEEKAIYLKRMGVEKP